MNKQFVAIVMCATSLAVLAQQPKIINTHLTVEPAGGNLTETVDRFRHSAEQVWLGYEVPALSQSHLSACSSGPDASQLDDGCCGVYRLEDSDYTSVNRTEDVSTPHNIDILLRFDHGRLTKSRAVMVGCHLDAGGVAFTWLTGVQPDASIGYLASAVSQAVDLNTSRIADQALSSISYHASPAATHTLFEISSSSMPLHIREQAAFWLGVRRGHEGFLALQSLEKSSTETAFREKLPFDFSRNSDPAADDELLRMAKIDADAKVRAQALFWIAQKAGRKATAALTDAIQNDPETEVKKKAVFALSQLPADEGVPELIHVAGVNTNLEVRKAAFFWLGQSKDPRALAYLEQVLKQ